MSRDIINYFGGEKIYTKDAVDTKFGDIALPLGSDNLDSDNAHLYVFRDEVTSEGKRNISARLVISDPNPYFGVEGDNKHVFITPTMSQIKLLADFLGLNIIKTNVRSVYNIQSSKYLDFYNIGFLESDIPTGFIDYLNSGKFNIQLKALEAMAKYTKSDSEVFYTTTKVGDLPVSVTTENFGDVRLGFNKFNVSEGWIWDDTEVEWQIINCLSIGALTCYIASFYDYYDNTVITRTNYIFDIVARDYPLAKKE